MWYVSRDSKFQMEQSHGWKSLSGHEAPSTMRCLLTWQRVNYAWQLKFSCAKPGYLKVAICSSKFCAKSTFVRQGENPSQLNRNSSNNRILAFEKFQQIFTIFGSVSKPARTTYVQLRCSNPRLVNMYHKIVTKSDLRQPQKYNGQHKEHVRELQYCQKRLRAESWRFECIQSPFPWDATI